MPRINGLVNGSSRAYGFKSAPVSFITYDTLNFTASGNLTVTNNGTQTVNIFKTSGSIGWDTQAYIATPYTAPCTIEFNKLADAGDNGASYAMMSWNADPTSNASYDTLDYASYPYATNSYQIYHNGGNIDPGRSWSTGSKFYIVYGTDGYIRHYNGSTLLYSVFYGIGNTVYVDSSYYPVNATYAGFSNIKVIKSAWNGTSYPNTAPNINLIIKLWGAGGAGGTAGGWSYGANGAGGGFVSATLAFPTTFAGTNLILQVGGGGQVNSTTQAFGGGGRASVTNSDNRYGSGGGGYTGLFMTSVSQANALAIAGGGGGGGSSRAGEGNAGGAGGGTTGQTGLSPYDGKSSYAGNGGTQSAGGAQASSDADNTNAPAGALSGGTARVNSYGGAGGGGYFGGSAGGYSESNTMGGGGGGSGYINPTYGSGSNIQGNYRTSAGTADAGYPGSVSTGGLVGTAGSNGFARITRNGVETTYSFTGTNITITLQFFPRQYANTSGTWSHWITWG